MNSLPQSDQLVKTTDQVAAGLLQSILNGSYSPNGALPDLGPHLTDIAGIELKYRDGGVTAAQAEFNARAKGNPSLYRLASSDLDQGGPGKRKLSQRYEHALSELGYTFALNQATGEIEVNGARLDDVMRATIRTSLRDAGLTRHLAGVEDFWVMAAGRAAYHPHKRWIEGLRWDGRDHIATFAAHFQDTHDPITYPDGSMRSVVHAYMRRWLIGAVCKLYGGDQNVMLVLDGPQGIGKSRTVQWLTANIPSGFTEGPLDPGNKDHELRLARFLVWEVAELGATMRRADVEALKDFLTRRYVTTRRAYARYETQQIATCSFVGTVNTSHGILHDPTGSRRFIACNLKAIDWAYTTLDPNQLWAQAYALRKAGHTGILTPEENRTRVEVNAGFEVPSALPDFFERVAKFGAMSECVKFGDLVSRLQGIGYQGTNRQIEMDLSGFLKGAELTGDCFRKRTNKGWSVYGVVLV